MWNLLDEEGGYVSDAYLDGPRGFAKGAPRCDETPATPPKTDAGTSSGGTGGTVDIEGPAVRPHVQFFADDGDLISDRLDLGRAVVAAARDPHPHHRRINRKYRK